jgi:AcrR family transcriptional regulator
MPRAFTADEATAIRAKLLAAGEESFARMGIRRTTVEELARAAGISKGAFYKFFDTKESLFLALLEDHEIRAHAEVEAAVRTDPHRGLDTLIDTALQATQRNPLLPVAMSQEGLRLLHGMTEAQREAFVERDVRLVERILERLHQAGVHVSVSSTVLVALLRSLVFVGWHRGEIGEGLAEELATWLTPTLRAALLSGSSSTEAVR